MLRRLWTFVFLLILKTQSWHSTPLFLFNALYQCGLGLYNFSQVFNTTLIMVKSVLKAWITLLKFFLGELAQLIVVLKFTLKRAGVGDDSVGAMQT